MSSEHEDNPASDLDKKSTKLGLFHRTLLLLGLGVVLAIGILFNPNSTTPLVMLIFLSVLFILQFVILYKFILILATKERLAMLSNRANSLALLTAFCLIFLIGLKTLNQLRAVDVFLVLLIESIVVFYLLRRF